MNIGERVAAWRAAAGLTQQGLGDLVGISGQAISSIEKGRSEPTVPTLVAIAQRTAGSMVKFFGRPPKPSRARKGTTVARAS